MKANESYFPKLKQIVKELGKEAYSCIGSESISIRDKLAHDWCMVFLFQYPDSDYKFLINEGYKYADTFIKISEENGKETTNSQQ